MSVQASRLAPIVLSVLLSLMGSLIMVHSQSAVLKKLGSIAELKGDFFNYAYKGKPIVTIEKLEEAYEKYKTLPEDVKQNARSVPDLRIFIDVALTPMQRPKDSRPDISVILDYYVKYRDINMFREQIRKTTISRDESTMKLYHKLVGLNGDPLEYDDFVAAKNEAQVLLKELNDLIDQGLVYEKPDQFKDLVSFFNYPFYWVLCVHVFPEMKYVDKVEALKSLVSNSLPLGGLRFNEAQQLEEIFAWDAMPGFLNVVLD